MAKIEYRGRKTLSKEWVYGGIVPDVYGGVPLIITDARKNDSCDIELEFEEVSPETVGQYTGLRDKNGKRIFEGDIIYDGCTKERVVFESGQWRTVNKLGYWAELHKYVGFIEVIGNIYDNPKLLGGTNDG